MERIYSTNKRNSLVAFILFFAAISLISGNQLSAANHFVTVWQGQNGQNHMNFMIVSAVLEKMPLSVDDELAVFSGSKCVGASKLTKAMDPTHR